jgi:predicted PurR-regulated permease PerM
MNQRPVESAAIQPVDIKTPLGTSVSRTDVMTICLVLLLIIAIVAVLYIGRAFFLPVVAAMILGTMLSPAAKRLEELRVPRSVSAVLIVGLTWTAFVMMVGLISAPLMEWTTKLPELGQILKTKMHLFDSVISFWRQIEALLGTPSDMEQSLTLPKIEWIQPTLEFLSPTFTELLLFLAVLVLFIASWPDLRRALVMNFSNHDARLRTLRILNGIESRLADYLLTVTLINAGVGVATGIACALAHMPNPAGLGALAATLNFIPIIGPIIMFVVLSGVGLIAIPTLAGAVAAPLAFAVIAFVEGHFVTPTIIGRRLSLNALAVFLALAFWTWLWGPMGAFLSSPLLIVGLMLKEHVWPQKETNIVPE